MEFQAAETVDGYYTLKYSRISKESSRNNLRESCYKVSIISVIELSRYVDMRYLIQLCIIYFYSVFNSDELSFTSNN